MELCLFCRLRYWWKNYWFRKRMDKQLEEMDQKYPGWYIDPEKRKDYYYRIPSRWSRWIRHPVTTMKQKLGERLAKDGVVTLNKSNNPSGDSCNE